MKDERIINTLMEYIKYYDMSVYDAIIELHEKDNIDIEDIVKGLDSNLLTQVKQECIVNNRVRNMGKVNKITIDDLF